MSAGRAFLRPAKDRPNLHIMLNTTVSRVLVHPRSKIAYGVEFIDPQVNYSTRITKPRQKFDRIEKN